MSTVSGLATASGVSPYLNAPREATPQFRLSRADLAFTPVAAQATASAPAGGAQSARPVAAPDASEQSLLQSRRESGDARYTQFVDAVTALRVDISEANLTKQRVAELRAAAKAVFRMDGVPEDRRPSLAEATAEANTQRVETAQRDEQRRRVEAASVAAERREAAAARNAEKIAESQARVVEPKPLPEVPAPAEQTVAPVTPEPKAPVPTPTSAAQPDTRVDAPSVDVKAPDLPAPDLPKAPPPPEATVKSDVQTGPDLPAAYEAKAAPPVPEPSAPEAPAPAATQAAPAPDVQTSPASDDA